MTDKVLRGFVGNGSNKGAWFDFPASVRAITKKLTGVENYSGDLWIEDYESPIPFSAKGMDIIEFNKMANALQSVPDIFVRNFKTLHEEGLFEDFQDLVDNWQGFRINHEVKNRADLGREYASENSLTINQIMDYVDFDHLGKDIDSDLTGCFTPDGYFEKV